MKVGQRPASSSGRQLAWAGFTIIETMVVLAVTGALFIGIIATISGRQNQAEFTHAIQSAQSQIQQVIDQVSNGYFPSFANYTCTQSGATLVLSAVANSQGTNQDCVFLGKVMQFGIQGTDPEQYRVYTIAGLRSATTGTTSPFQTADPTVVGVSGDYTDYSTVTSLEYGLKTAWMKVCPSTCTTDIGAFGIMMEPGNFSSSSGYTSGTQSVDLVPVLGTAIGQSVTQATGAINSTTGLNDANLTADAPINPAYGVQICLASGGTNQSGLIQVGNNGRKLIVKLNIYNDQTCT